MNNFYALADPELSAAKTESQFCKDVISGLSNTPKTLHSKYFYDEKGDQLFQQIMAMPEYYLTRAELEIFRDQTSALADVIQAEKSPFDLIELGAGDASKSKFLLNYLVEKQIDFTYHPIDISGHILNELEDNLTTAIPALAIHSLEGEYFQMLEEATNNSQRRKVVLFLGGNIGNMELDKAYLFCQDLRARLNPGDIVLMGFDLKKNPHQILAAYNDKQGITAAFNLNLLTRINRELDGNLDLSKFSHYQHYDPVTGACRSFLVSLEDQKTMVCGNIVCFAENELIHMEVSQKFSRDDITDMAVASGFIEQDYLNDKNNWFTDVIWIAN